MSINFDDKYDNKIITNLINIYKTIKSNPTIKEKYITNENALDRKYPYVYRLIKFIYNLNIHTKYFDNLPNINNYTEFLKWYHHNNSKIDIYVIQNDILKDYNDVLKDHNDIYNDDIVFSKNNKKLYNNPFIPISIHYEFEKNKIYYVHAAEKNIKIKIYSINDIDNTNKQPNINKICDIIKFILTIANKKNMNVDLTIYYSNQKKTIDYTKNSLDFENINSGSTYVEINITIFREEELYKVLVHEMIHYVLFDYNRSDLIFTKIDNILRKNIKINGKDMNNESYTETLAIILNCVINSVILNKSFNNMINTERKFSIFQTSKILEFYNLNNFEQLFTNHKNHIIFNQTTSVCSYFIIKTFNILLLDDFFKYINENGFTIKKNNITTNNYEKFYLRVINLFKNNNNKTQKFKNMINDLIIKIKKNKNKDFIHKTLRMSCNC
jgi:hypothetical protein